MDATERRKRASAEASEWFVRLQADDLARACREQYVDWLRDSPTHVAEMLRIAQVHGVLEQFERWGRIGTEDASGASNVVELAHPDGQEMERPAQPAGRDFFRETRRKKLGLFALAASLVAAVAIAVLLPKVRGQVIDTERGERREVVLSDGSVVQVDPQTYLRVKFQDHVRWVYLERGRALFHVARNPERPFFVQTAGTMVRAVGTAFGVERDAGGVVVTVAEGKVAVLRSATRYTSPSSTGAGGSHEPSREQHGGEGLTKRKDESFSHLTQQAAQSGELFLTAGQQLTVQSSGLAEPVRKVDSNHALAWAEGRLIFENDRVSRVVQEFNRYNRVQLHVTDEALARRTVSGVFSASDPESFVAFLRTVAPVNVVRRDGEDITISLSKPQ